MSTAPARHGLWFALTLALPATFGGAWLWLVPGRLVARAAADEQRAAAQLLENADAALGRELQSLAGGLPIALELDGERRIVAPFAPRIDVDPVAAVASVAEQAGNARVAAGELDAALPFFAHAADDGTLTPQGWLGYAAARAHGDTAAARALLEDARSHHRGARCGPLPFALLLLLAEARIDPTAAPRWTTEFLAAMREVPATAVPAVLAELDAAAPAFAQEQAPALRAAAAAAAHHRQVAVGLEPAREPDGSVLVPIDPDHCAAVPAEAVARACTAALAVAAAGEPGLRIATDHVADGAPQRRIATLGATWSALPTSTPTSALLAVAAHTSLLLALATLVLGNLLLWRLTRRESQLVRLRADFVDIVSHELRTPLTAIALKSEMLATDDVPPARRAHYLHALHHDVRRLVDQVERILDFGRLQRGAPLRMELVPARTLLARGLRQGRPALRLVAQKVDIEADRGLPAIVGDVDVLGRALRNLLENAAKYAPPGSTVAVRAFAQGNELVVEVADRGPGVSAADRGSIFQPFVRGSGAPPGTPGSGLGLALVAAAAQSHDGRVAVHERPGGGAVFTLSLPARPGAGAVEVG